MSEVSGYRAGIPQNPGQNSRPVNNTGDVAQTGGVKGSQKVQRAIDKGTEQTSQVVHQEKLPTIARKVTSRDIVNQLLLLGVRPSSENRSLAMKMLMLGMELSEDNFSKLTNLLKGLQRTATTEQAAIILTNKGLPSKTAVIQLANFLDNNPQLASQLTALLQASGEAQQALAGQTILSPALSAQLASILGSLEGFLSSLPQEIRKKIANKDGLFSKSELLTNLRAFKALITGVEQQVASSDQASKPNANNFLSTMANLASKAKDAAENIIVQAIMSRPESREDSALQDKFAYWQIPNSMAGVPQTIELLIQKDKRTKYKNINPKKTKLVLKTETAELGELAVELDVDGDNVDFRFNTNDDKIRDLINREFKSLKDSIEKQQYKTRTVRVVKRNLDVKKFLIPTLDLNDLTRVQTEV